MLKCCVVFHRAVKIFGFYYVVCTVREWQLNWQHVSITAPVSSLIQIFIQNVCNGRNSFTLKSERFNMTITEGKHNKLSRCQFNRFRVSCTFSHRSLKACKHGLYAMMVKIPSKMEIANYESEPSEISRSRKISWDFALDFVSKRLENRDRERKNLDLVSKNEIRKAKISILSRKTR